MTARRILDAAAIFKASRAVAYKHVKLRKNQLDAYSKTSSLAKAAASQTDRVTLTVKAASALAGRLHEKGPNNPSHPSNADGFGGAGSESANGKSEGKSRGGKERQGIAQDHFYKRSEDDGTVEPLPRDELSVRQEQAKRYPLPDGSIPSAQVGPDILEQDKGFYSEVPQSEPAKDPLYTQRKGIDSSFQPASSGRTSIPELAGRTEHLSPEQAKELQRQSERHIPLPSAGSLSKGSESELKGSNLTAGQAKDVFYSRSHTREPVLSALRSIELPKNTGSVQASDDHVSDDHMDQDAFYSTESKAQEQAVPEMQAVPEQEQIPDEAYSEIFRSPRVAKMLREQPMKDTASKGLHFPGTRDTIVSKTKVPEGVDQESSSLRISLQNPKASPTAFPSGASAYEGEDVQDLAADIAKDAQLMSANDAERPNITDNYAQNPSYEMRESRVPSSRFGRIWQYGGLAASMTFGAVGESLRRVTGRGGDTGSSLMLSAGNMERLVAKLSRMRGAALKLGQMMSFQDSKMLPGPINEVLQRVQDSADYMPASQRNKVLASNLGSEWRGLFESFDEKPIAAASIGQVHSAILKSSGQRVAVKVQYPGVASSIDSDLSNLSILLTASRLLPKGLYLDKTIANARTELAWECDYLREAKMGSRFRELLSDEIDIFHVPAVITEASGSEVLTAEFCEGIGVTKAQNFTQEQRDWIGSNILRLCLKEITEFKFMQTDPNWTNFLFNAKTHKLELLDFGASRDFPDKFIIPYIQTLLAASRSDRATVRDLSIELGYLTGHESQAMLNAHVGSVLTLAEPFMDTAPEVYDFRDQTITDRVRGFIPVMVRERLAPPPEETYSLHRKLSGAFLLCARLGSRVNCRQMFADAMGKAGVV